MLLPVSSPANGGGKCAEKKQNGEGTLAPSPFEQSLNVVYGMQPAAPDHVAQLIEPPSASTALYIWQKRHSM